MNSFWQRFGRYLLQRLGEPTTWAGIVGVLTGFGIKIAPQAWDSITSVGLFIASGLLMAAREGRNKPDNASLPTTIKGEMPPPKPAIVPPNTEGMKPVDAGKSAVDPAGEVHSQP